MEMLAQIFVFAIPSGLGLYYFVSGLFMVLDQFVVNLIEVQKKKGYVTA